MQGLEGKVVIVTGAARGIGAAVAARLAEGGAKVALLDMNEVGLAEVERSINANGGEALAVTFNITCNADFPQLVDRIERVLGPVDALVNNVGWEKIAPFLDTDLALWDKIIDINLRGPIALTHQVLGRMS